MTPDTRWFDARRVEFLAAVGILALVLVSMCVWIYGFAHPFFNHERAGIAILILCVPVLALLYVLLHRCPDRVSAHPA